MSDFLKSDVLAVAEALLYNSYTFEGNYNSMSESACYECNHCSGLVYEDGGSPVDIVHELDCVVLIARDLLTLQD